MTVRKNGKNTASRDPKGRFAAGNSGRPLGARNKATVVAAKLLEGEAEAITRKAIEQALAGDPVALRLCLERILPRIKERTIELKLPKMESACDANEAAATVIERVCAGALCPSEGAQCMGMIETFRRTLETSELERRIEALEADDGEE